VLRTLLRAALGADTDAPPELQARRLAALLGLLSQACNRHVTAT